MENTTPTRGEPTRMNERPPSVLLKTPLPLDPAYTMLSSSGSTNSPYTVEPRPRIGVQVAAPFVDRNAPSPVVPAYTTFGLNGLIARENTWVSPMPAETDSQVTPPSIVFSMPHPPE